MSIVASVRRQFVPIHREGWPYIAAFAVAGPDPGLDLGTAGLDRLDPDRLVHLFLPRSRPRDAAARGAGDFAGRRPRLDDHHLRAAGRAGPVRRRR